MKSKDARHCLRTFLEVSQLQIDSRNAKVKRLDFRKTFLNTAKKREVNEEIDKLLEERNAIQGRLDSVRLEMLDIIKKDPCLLSNDLLCKKGYYSVSQLVDDEKSKILERGSYRDNPYSIADVLNVVLSTTASDNDFSLFTSATIKATPLDVENASRNKQNVKKMIKKM